MIVQAVPRDSVDVTIDGHTVQRDASVGDVLGPFAVRPGRHEVGFSGRDALHVRSSVTVRPGSSSDIVIHLPAEEHGDPVVNSYRTPRSSIAPGRARVLIAHTATVAPADVRVDGEVVFRNIANGEYATADIAAGGHTVALLPAGLDRHPILGPLHVDLAAGTVTMVYAVGNPRNSSMNVITHTDVLKSNGAVVPANIDTGRAGLAAQLVVHPFRVSPRTRASAPAPSLGSGWGWELAGVAVIVSGVMWRVSRRRRGAPGRRA
jgi:Domain of unknown function (DUF4397)